MSFGCEFCGRVSGHASSCPYFSPPETFKYCSGCGEGIYEGEEYVENDDGECQHLDCFMGIRDLSEWLGYKVKIMEEYV